MGGGEIILEYAIYHSPLAFIRRLLELGADPNYGDHAGFPSLIAALSCGARKDRDEILELLLANGADIQQRGMNDYTPLHTAVGLQDLKAPAPGTPRGGEGAGDRGLRWGGSVRRRSQIGHAGGRPLPPEHSHWGPNRAACRAYPADRFAP